MENEKIKEEKEIEDFIEWLRHFYLLAPKKKDKIIKKINKVNTNFGNWLESIKEFDFDSQDKLIEELRYAQW